MLEPATSTELFHAIATTTGIIISNSYPLFILLISGMVLLTVIGGIILAVTGSVGSVLK